MDPYEVLGVDADADEDAVERAFRRRVKEAHPDQGGTAAEFRAVMDAYERLTSDERPDASALTDEYGVEEPDSPPAGAGPRPGPGSTAPGGAQERETKTKVEYLNYEVLDDHGWTLDDEDLFEKAADAGLDPDDYGRFVAPPDETLLEAAEGCGYTWPYSCRGGACANCAVAVVDGGLDLAVNHVLPSEMVDRGIQLSCIGTPTTDDLRVVFNVKHLPDVEEYLLPPGPFKRHLND